MIISKGLKSIADFTSFLVPIMGILYLLVALYIVFCNIDIIPSLLLKIIKEAFDIKALGWGIISSIIIGVQRGIFSSEAGIGTGAVASGTSDTSKPVDQGYIQMLGVYFTSFIICTSTALIILTKFQNNNNEEPINVDINNFIDPNGIEITLEALKSHLGNIGTIILLISIICFAFSTIISGYYYGESNIKYLSKKINSKYLLILNVLVAFILFYGAIIKPSVLWNFVDIGVALLAIINTISMMLLRKKIIFEYNKEGSNNL